MSVATDHKVIVAELPVNVTFHIWLKARRVGEPGAISLISPNGKFGEVLSHNLDEYDFRIYHVFGGGPIELHYDAERTVISVIYWFTAVDVLEAGITVLHTNGLNAPPDLPDSYHFRPPFGWMNDPNGFGRFDGRPHLFYQHYSHGLSWNTMHWGHAVSSDYLRWRHLPIFLFPSEELSAWPDKRGGAFSGSAIALPNAPGIRVFYTDQLKDRQPEEQIQMTATSADLFSAGKAEVILPHRPDGEGLTLDFRDPYVFKGPDGLWKMLLGSQSAEGGVILLYDTEDRAAAEGWTYRGKLLVEHRHRTTAIECPCLLPLDGPATHPATHWVLIYGLMNSEDAESRRKNLTMAEIGWFDGQRFVKDFEQELDFGTDNYAFQAFLDGDMPVGIGWLANWADANAATIFPTAMTLPRTLKLQDGHLLTPPIGAAESLRHRVLDRVRLASGGEVVFPNGAVEILFEMAEPGLPFTLNLDHPALRLAISSDEEGLELIHGKPGEDNAPRYLRPGARIKRLRVFLDYGSIEIFADHGRHVATKRLDGFDPIQSARLVAEPGSVAWATVWSLRL
ncbi:GH32 C-terminal domain-containing protein [Rhizobium paknamense]|nr:GH32 C-terminal domain-containing protein [Rhizobium paknamense]